MNKKAKFAITLITLPTILIISFLFVPSTQASPYAYMALHTSGRNIYNANGNLVYLRGVGIMGMAPNLIFWGDGEIDSWAKQWDNTPEPEMRAAFQAMRDKYHVNMIRVFCYPSWIWRDNLVPAQEDSGQSGKTYTISTRQYLKTLCNVAAEYGIYVNLVPYAMVPNNANLDPYYTPENWQGCPMMGWIDAPTRFFNDAGYGTAEYGGNEAQFWRDYYTMLGNLLKDCPNIIYEAWNEIGWRGGDTEPVPDGYKQYCKIMYDSVKAADPDATFMYQWHMGWVPNGWGATLSWVREIHDYVQPSNNVIYTTHFYYQSGWGPDKDNGAARHPTWGWQTDYNSLKSNVQTCLDTMGVDAPLVINEQGSCLQAVRVLIESGYSMTLDESYTWNENILKAQRDLGVGACLYNWASENGIGNIYSAGLAIMSDGNGWVPNKMGQGFINAYKPTPTVNPTNSPTLQPTVTPSESPISRVDAVLIGVFGEYTELTQYVLIGLITFVTITYLTVRKKKYR